MIELAYGFDTPVAEFVARHIEGCSRGFESFKAIGVVRDGALIGGIVYHNWAPEAGAIEMSAAATDARWLMGPTLHAMFAYPFDDLACQAVVLRVSEKNRRMCRIAERFGFDGYRIPRLRGKDEAEMIFTLTAEQWRQTPHERKRHGKIVSTNAA